MDSSLVGSLVREQDKSKHWESKPILQHGGVSIDLSLAIGDNAITPPGAPGQPDQYPKKSKYQFDVSRFKGVESEPEMNQLIKETFPGCKWISQKRGVKVQGGHIFQWRCEYYPVRSNGVTKPAKSNFEAGHFTKKNVKHETNKQRAAQSAYQRMSNPKMKSSSRKRKRLKAADRRGRRAVYEKQEGEVSLNKRTHSKRADDPTRRCHANVKTLVSDYCNGWFLMPDCDFHHCFHLPEEPDASLLNESDLSEDNLEYMRLMFNAGVGDQTVANIMTQMLNKQGRPGEFLASTIQNIHTNCQAAMDEIAAISADATVAERTLERLNRYVKVLLFSIPRIFRYSRYFH